MRSLRCDLITSFRLKIRQVTTCVRKQICIEDFAKEIGCCLFSNIFLVEALDHEIVKCSLKYIHWNGVFFSKEVTPC